ncbi:hypothetical protein Tco_1378309 [Tanacetum coccineum]
MVRKNLNGKEKSSVSHSPSAHQADSMSNDRDGKTLGMGDDGVYLGTKSFVQIVTEDKKTTKMNFRTLINKKKVDNSDCVLRVKYVLDAQSKFSNSLVGFFVGKRVAFQLVQNYVTNTWAKFGFQKVMKDDDDVYYFKFTSMTGLEQCRVEPWGRIGFARSLIEVTAGKELKQEVTMAVPIVEGDGHTMERMNIEYEWKPSRCRDCKIFGHADDQCPKRVKEPVMETPTIQNDGFTMVQNQKKKGKETTNTQTRHADGFKLFNDMKVGMKWVEASGGKGRVVRGLPWLLLGDFNVALNMEDISTGSSSMNSAMCDFKDCVRSIEVMDIHSTGLHFTWNQKPRGRNGVLKKLDRIMGNLEFIDTYQGHPKVDKHDSMAETEGQCEELQIINVCFANDVFIFTHGDVESASVIKASLDEFKKVSGLFPSIPKSTAFFCNVLNHVKAAILNFMPFAEGELPVNYLGVPLISSRLLNKDCKVLVEKARNRIGDWKNKSLSYSGRLQLCKSVISSMQVYWASILVIPIRIVGDIQQIIRGFLWCNGEYKRGKAKVAWDDICLPKKEGGLRLRSLEVFNLALMTTHIWNLVSNKESFCIGNGMNTSLWYDTWSTHCPLCKLLSPKDITREGYSIHTCVADLIVNGAWNWPFSWLAKAPNLGLVPTPTLTASSQDRRKWRDTNATDLTQVRCSLYGTQADSHEHLFFECSYSSKVWSLIRGFVGMDVENIIAWFQPLANKRTVQNIVGKILIAAATYFIWLEWNNRLFKRTRRSPEDLRDAIVITVRLKLVSFRFKNKEKVRNFLSLWKMPTAFRFYGKVV